MYTYQRGLLIGRFQPFHKGHLYLLHHVKKKVKKLVIGVGSANVFDEDNPFSYEERKQMVEKVITEERLKNFIDSILPLNDYYDDERWFLDIRRVTGGRFDIIIGNNEWTNGIFEKQGYKILRAGFFKRYIYEGEKIRSLIRQKKQWSDRVPDYLVKPIIKLLNERKKIPYRFQHIGIGGTFDHFHKGHKRLIDTALRYGHFVSIGVTTKPLYTEKNFSNSIENYAQRKKSVANYLKKKHALKRTIFFPLSDIYGTTKTDGTIEAIVVSKETYSNAIKINKLRHKKSLPELKIIRIDNVKADDGELISSERIRSGEINRQGKCYMLHITCYKKTLILPENLREKLRKPLGKVIRGSENEQEKTVQKILHFINIMKSKPPMVIAVGDIITNSLEKTGFIPDVKIIDYRSRREKITNKIPMDSTTLTIGLSEVERPNSKFQTLKKIVNKPGTISKESVNAIKKAIDSCLSHPSGVQPQKIQKIVIDGEEDLLALPAILLAPLNSVVLYGQMDLGVVMVEVNEIIKNKVKKILKKFFNQI